MQHLDEGTLHALLDGEIPSAELPPIQAHLGACAECRARLAEEQELLAESDRLIEVLEPPGAAPAVAPVRKVPRRVWPTRLAWAATLVLAAGLGYSARGGPAEPTAAVSPDSGSAFRAAEPAAAPAPPADQPVNQGRDAASESRRQTALLLGQASGARRPLSRTPHRPRKKPSSGWPRSRRTLWCRRRSRRWPRPRAARLLRHRPNWLVRGTSARKR